MHFQSIFIFTSDRDVQCWNVHGDEGVEDVEDESSEGISPGKEVVVAARIPCGKGVWSVEVLDELMPQNVRGSSCFRFRFVEMFTVWKAVSDWSGRSDTEDVKCLGCLGCSGELGMRFLDPRTEFRTVPSISSITGVGRRHLQPRNETHWPLRTHFQIIRLTSKVLDQRPCGILPNEVNSANFSFGCVSQCESYWKWEQRLAFTPFGASQAQHGCTRLENRALCGP